ncbi:cation:dicarboxylase symporter family transporter [Sinomonas sp. ASV486]|uniref:cation:dicarboxylate symporter family transporter n=1 Tax=Sinomonas sp. ASV486 TaxID=3051170 RepID=UPI0027DC3FF4|nr:cation:dicarboxylase symporter family transporter [Sinomonas sp. ASV486]MDQ4491569.1 cation:dicarboxylase symporter family transporter [Sinomonas sp. ASV486]
MSTATAPRPRKAWYRGLGAQVMIAMVLGIAVGFAFPDFAKSLKIVGDLFLALIKTGIAPLVFLTVVTGILSAGNLKRASRIGFSALIYFEIISTLALAIGLLAGNLLGVGQGAGALTSSSGKPPATNGDHSLDGFLTQVFPSSFVGAFTSTQLLQVVILAIIFGAGLLAIKPDVLARISSGLDTISEAFFGLVNVVMKLAPIGAFGAIAYSVASNGSSMLVALAALVAEYWIVVAVFITVVLGLVALAAGFNLFRLLVVVRDEMSMVLGTASSESALPGLLRKLPAMGCSQQSVGLVVPTGYAFNLDGTSIYMAVCTLFLANAYGVHMGWPEQIGLLLIMLLTSKGAATVSGGTYVVFASTVAATGYLPVEGVAILFGVYRFMSMATAFCNTFGNVVATVVISRLTRELDRDRFAWALANPSEFLAELDASPSGHDIAGPRNPSPVPAPAAATHDAARPPAVVRASAASVTAEK